MSANKFCPIGRVTTKTICYLTIKLYVTLMAMVVVI